MLVVGRFVTRDGEACEGSLSAGEKGDDSEEEEDEEEDDEEEESDGSFTMVPVDKEEEPGGSSISSAVTSKGVTSSTPKNSPGDNGRITRPLDKLIPYSPRPL
mmetsp:Transcript_17908/g.29093  ORF Transcript_17908/g.29093 Transcript_17908/m.29093 type:complete len:103 (+) Transcript_17908:668-976(+)